MRLKNGCNAGWYELNISSADNCVAPCCYYAGGKDPWSDQPLSVEDYWNSPNMQVVRKINSEAESDLSAGCANCYYFKYKDGSASYFPDFLTPSDDLSEAQRTNWLQAIDDYRTGRTLVRSRPLRYYVNFGFACNLYCTMCHQVPRRKTLKRQVSNDILLKWRDSMQAAIDITVIGGEPFVMTEAVAFIKSVIEDPSLEQVQLTICTNGTMHHKYLDLLSRKRKLQLTVSLDTIGAEFEKIRVGASWKAIEQHILAFVETGRKLGYNWKLQTPCMLLKSNVCRLVDFVDWAMEHGALPGFYDFINARGIEKTFEEENLIAHPYLVNEIPDWESYFLTAVARLRSGGLTGPANQLDSLRAAIQEKLTLWQSGMASVGNLVQITGGPQIYSKQGPTLFASLERNIYGTLPAAEPISISGDRLLFSPTHLNDHLSTPYIEIPKKMAAAGRWIRVRCVWPDEGVSGACKLYLQDDGFNTLQCAESNTAGANDLEFVRHFELPDQTNKIRIVMTARGMEPVYAPKEVMIETLDAR